VRDCWRVAIIDSGVSDGPVAGDARSDGARADGARRDDAPASGARAGRSQATVIAARRFADNGRSVSLEPTIPDPIGHGTAVTHAICGMPANIELLIGQVLDDKRVTTPAAVAAGIYWAVEAGADLIHMSLGLRQDRRVLADAVASAVQAGCVVVASTPARGAATYPASYPGVIRATGDARCAEGEISALDPARAHFGGCPNYPGCSESGGASIGAANVSASVVARLAPGSAAESVRAQLISLARYHGAERRLA